MPIRTIGSGSQLIGGAKSPRDAVGATVYLTAGGIRQRGDVMSGGSYESSNDQRLHFGLGQAATVEGVEIHWPSGSVEHVNLPGVDRFFVIEEGKGVVPSVYDAIAKKRRHSVAQMNAASGGMDGEDHDSCVGS